MVTSDLARFALMLVAAAVIAADGPAAVVYATVAVSQVVGTVFRPAQSALLPGLVRTPSELTAANVASSTIESIGTFLGPALGGLLLAVSERAGRVRGQRGDVSLVGRARLRAARAGGAPRPRRNAGCG